ncbi:MAG: acyltransferase [Acidimicrobiia bacterium]
MSNEQPASIHPSAIVEEGAVIGPAAAIWHHCHVRADATVGAGSTLGKNVFVDAGVTIGPRCKIQNNVSVYHGVTLEAEVFVGPSAVFTNDLRPRAVSPTWAVVPTVVRHGASIGANATVVCGTTLGSYCMVAAGSVVTRDVADHQLVRGNPARHAAWVCRCGEIVSRALAAPPELRCERCRTTGEGHVVRS